MVISGVVILIQPEKSASILEQLQKTDGVTTYGVHKDNYLIAVLEASDETMMKQMSMDIPQKIDGILGVYPTYMHYEKEE